MQIQPHTEQHCLDSHYTNSLTLPSTSKQLMANGTLALSQKNETPHFVAQEWMSHPPAPTPFGCILHIEYETGQTSDKWAASLLG